MWGGGVVVKTDRPIPGYVLGGNKLDRLLAGGRIQCDFVVSSKFRQGGGSALAGHCCFREAIGSVSITILQLSRACVASHCLVSLDIVNLPR